MADVDALVWPPPALIFGVKSEPTALVWPPPVLVQGRIGASAGGSTPPTVTFIDPLPDEPIRRQQAIVFDITDVDGDISLVCISVEFEELGVTELAARGLFNPTDVYDLSTSSAITDGLRITLRRNGGWIATPRILVDVADAGGNVS